MIILGAKGHALEILDVLYVNKLTAGICFFDNRSSSFDIPAINRFTVLRTEEALQQELFRDNRFVLGIGSSAAREKMTEYVTGLGGKLVSVISANAYISQLDVLLGEGLNIMHGAIVHPGVSVGYGSLINSRAVIHHQSTIGRFCEVCPGAILTGAVELGNKVMIGAGAVILPKVRVGNNCIIGAGSVVLKDVPDNTVVAGNPAKVLRLIKNQEND